MFVKSNEGFNDLLISVRVGHSTPLRGALCVERSRISAIPIWRFHMPCFFYSVGTFLIAVGALVTLIVYGTLPEPEVSLYVRLGGPVTLVIGILGCFAPWILHHYICDFRGRYTSVAKEYRNLPLQRLNPRLLWTVPAESDNVALAWSADGHWLGLVTNCECLIWSTDDWSRIYARHTFDWAEYVNLTFQPQTASVLITRGHDVPMLWDFQTDECHRICEASTDDNVQAAFSPDGRLLALGENDGTDPSRTKVWDLKANRVVMEINGAIASTFSPDGETLVTSTLEHLLLFDTKTWKQELLSRWEHPPFPSIGYAAEGFEADQAPIRVESTHDQRFMAIKRRQWGDTLETKSGSTLIDTWDYWQAYFERSGWSGQICSIVGLIPERNECVAGISVVDSSPELVVINLEDKTVTSRMAIPGLSLSAHWPLLRDDGRYFVYIDSKDRLYLVPRPSLNDEASLRSVPLE